MIGVVLKHGTYQGRPALLLTYYGGASIWSYHEEGWVEDERETDECRNWGVFHAKVET